MSGNAVDTETADALWTLLKQQNREVREDLAARLDESLKAGEACKKEEGQKGRCIPSKEAMEFVKRLSVQGGEKVPPDERGIFALLDEKHSR